MNSTYNSKKQFRSMFLQSLKPASIMAICAFLCFMFFSLVSTSVYSDYSPYRDTVQSAGFFWDDVRVDANFFANTAFIAAGVFNAAVLFNFAWSKKQINVIFSLGMKKSDIYISKILGGLVPMFLSILIAGIIETSLCASLNYSINGRYILMAGMTMLQFFLAYALSFLMCSGIFSASGNIIEGVVYVVLIGCSLPVLESLLDHLFWYFTHGAYMENQYFSDIGIKFGQAYELTETWNWENPFYIFFTYNDGHFLNDYFDKFNTELPTIKHWSGFISAGIYSVIAFVIGLFGFINRRNEITSTWGRAKVLNEIGAGFAGFYGIYLMNIVNMEKHGDGSLGAFLLSCIAFLVVYIIMKLIFGYKRKKEIKTAINRFPAYAIVYAAICLIFTLGLFGYSSYIPDASEIEYVTVSTPTYKFMDDAYAESAYFGLKLQNLNTNDAYNPDLGLNGDLYDGYQESPEVRFTDSGDINKVLKIHEAFIADGKIKNSGAHSCATNVQISYTLKNGKVVNRYYTETTEGTAQKLILLNDTNEVGVTLSKYLKTYIDIDDYRNALTSDSSNSYAYWAMHSSTLADSAFYELDFDKDKSDLMLMEDCYIFPKDMSKGFNLGVIDTELYKAIAKDISDLSAKQFYQHSAEDELGVLSFGISQSEFLHIEYGDESSTVAQVYDKDELSEEEAKSVYGETSWNLNSNDIKTVVITKDMKNTLAYFEKHDLMKYFTPARTASDIKSVKLATLGELYGEKNKSYNYPTFYSSFWLGSQMQEWTQSEEGKYYVNHFLAINNEITDKDRIETLLDEAILFGLCSNDSRIMEITYNDGAVATVMVPANAKGLR